MKAGWKIVLVATLMMTSIYSPSAVNAQQSKLESRQGILTDIEAISMEKQKAIREAVALGLITGYPNGEFRPEQTLTRQELAVLLAKALKLDVSTPKSSTFTDIESGNWAVKYIEAVKNEGVMGGTGASFHPEQGVSREELATVLVRVVGGLGTKGGNAVQANDLSTAGRWAQASVEASLRLGLMDADGDGFAPKKPLQRQDIAQLLVDIFPERETTGIITKIEGDVIFVDGKPTLVTEDLRQLLLNRENVAALEGAVLRYKTAVRNVKDLSELEILSTGSANAPVPLNTAGMPAGGQLKVSGDYVSITGGGSVSALIISPSAKVTLGKGIHIEQLIIPDGASLSSVIANYDQVRGQIGKVETDKGIAVTPPITSISTPSAPTTPSVSQDELDRQAVAVDKAALAIGYASGDAASNVTQGLTLPVNGANGTTITWVSDAPGVITTNGTVVRPAYTAADATVKLTATIARGGASETREYTVTVIKAQMTDAEAVALDKAALTIGYASGDAASNVTQALTLPVSGANGTTITWTSDAPGVIAANGTVVRPAYTAADATVKLTATIARGGASETREYTVTVSKAQMTDAEAVALDKASLAIGYASGDAASNVTQALTLPVSGANGTTITWTS
ncbi:immunoglobulin-like domain-containing protein, partial [Paenibacillus xanthanilyticus]